MTFLFFPLIQALYVTSTTLHQAGRRAETTSLARTWFPLRFLGGLADHRHSLSKYRTMAVCLSKYGTTARPVHRFPNPKFDTPQPTRQNLYKYRITPSLSFSASRRHASASATRFPCCFWGKPSLSLHYPRRLSLGPSLQINPFSR